MASGLFCLPMEYNLEQETNFLIDFNSVTADRFKCMLSPDTWTPNYSTHSVKSDVTAEVSGTGYSAGGESLTSVTFVTAGERLLGMQRMSSGLGARLLMLVTPPFMTTISLISL